MLWHQIPSIQKCIYLTTNPTQWSITSSLIVKIGCNIFHWQICWSAICFIFASLTGTLSAWSPSKLGNPKLTFGISMTSFCTRRMLFSKSRPSKPCFGHRNWPIVRDFQPNMVVAILFSFFIDWYSVGTGSNSLAEVLPWPNLHLKDASDARASVQRISLGVEGRQYSNHHVL